MGQAGPLKRHEWPSARGKGEIGMPRMQGRPGKTLLWTLVAVLLVVIVVVVVLYLQGVI